MNIEQAEKILREEYGLDCVSANPCTPDLDDPEYNGSTVAEYEDERGNKYVFVMYDKNGNIWGVETDGFSDEVALELEKRLNR